MKQFENAENSRNTKFRKHSVLISTTISNEFWNLAKEHNISWADAMRTGISLLLAEKGVLQYDNKLNILRRVSKLSKIAEEASQKVEELTEKLALREGIKMKKLNKTTKTPVEEAEEILHEEPVKE